MRVTVKLYAGLGEFLPPGSKDNSTPLQVEPDATVSRVIERLNVPPERAHLVLLNGIYVKPEEWAAARLVEDDTIAMWPPVAGG